MIYLDANRSNEVKAREGIDTRHHGPLVHTILGSNEVKAREGIDTTSSISHHFTPSLCSNEVKAREGIDTIPICISRGILGFPGSNEVKAREGIDTQFYPIDTYYVTPVAMRLKPVRALTQEMEIVKNTSVDVAMRLKPVRALTQS